MYVYLSSNIVEYDSLNQNFLFICLNVNKTGKYVVIRNQSGLRSELFGEFDLLPDPTLNVDMTLFFALDELYDKESTAKGCPLLRMTRRTKASLLQVIFKL